MNIAFRQVRKIPTMEIDPDAIEYRDEDGTVWWVPRGHRFWNDIYEPWLAAGNTPLGPDEPWPEN